MSTIVKDITEAIEARLVIVLTTSKPLDYTINIGKNDFNNNENRFGVNPLEAVPGLSITKAYTLAQNFEIVLTTGFINDHDEKKQRAVTFTLYERMHNMFADLFQSKLGLAGTVLNVNEPSLSDMEYLKSTAILKGILIITYRQAV